jgi:Ca2+:H+ antiporter
LTVYLGEWEYCRSFFQINFVKQKNPYLHWTVLVPFFSWLIFLIGLMIAAKGFQVLLAAALVGCVLASVHHAETIAHRVGEPFGTLVLAIAVTVIEVALIVSLMIAGGGKDAGLARDTVFAAVMIILTGMIGGAILIGSYKYREQSFGVAGVNSTMIVLISISVLTLILPNYTLTTPGPAYSESQLVFVAIVTLLLYGTFIFVQNFKHKTDFLDDGGGAAGGRGPDDGSIEGGRESTAAGEEDDHAVHPTNAQAVGSLGLLLVCLCAVVLIAKKLSPSLESGVNAIGAPKSLVGVIIALIVLLPEGLAAFQAARANKLQKALNLSLGSALASIGLTIPAVAVVSLVTGLPLSLGIDAKSTVLFLLSLLVMAFSLSTGRTTVLQGVVLLILFAVYLFTTIVP